MLRVKMLPAQEPERLGRRRRWVPRATFAPLQAAALTLLPAGGLGPFSSSLNPRSSLHESRHSSLAIKSRSSHVSQAIFKGSPGDPQSKSIAGRGRRPAGSSGSPRCSPASERTVPRHPGEHRPRPPEGGQSPDTQKGYPQTPGIRPQKPPEGLSPPCPALFLLGVAAAAFLPRSPGERPPSRPPCFPLSQD